MIYLNKNSTNRLALTLNELSEIYKSGGTPYYLFQFENSQTKDLTYFNPISISANSRANIFEIIDGNTPNYSGGTVDLITGFYEYRIYEQSTQYNLQLSGTTSIVEYGKAFVQFGSATNFSYTANTSNNIIYYN